MRRMRWLLLAAILAIVFWVSAAYVKKQSEFRGECAGRAGAARSALRRGVADLALRFKLDKATGLPVWKLRAKEARELKSPPVTELEGVELELYNKDGRRVPPGQERQGAVRRQRQDAVFGRRRGYRHERSGGGSAARAHGEDPHLRRHVSKKKPGRRARTARCRVRVRSGQRNADGRGLRSAHARAAYARQVSLDWRGKTAESVPMHIEAGEAYYREKESKVILLPWSKMTRDTLSMEGGMSRGDAGRPGSAPGDDHRRARRCAMRTIARWSSGPTSWICISPTA